MEISENSRRIARNTALLYGRMLLLLFIGLFTSRVVLGCLGQEDYGTYGAVGGIVAMFTTLTAAISTAISRYITCELGRADMAKLKRVFATSVVVQILFCVVVLILTETLGVWFLNSHMNIPEGRMGAANVVLQCSMVVLMINLMSVPFNATIIAHEHMRAFAIISVVEAVLKLSVALLLYKSGIDKLITYAVLMMGVALIVRVSYGTYCNRHFEESRAKLCLDRKLIGEMTAFAGWNALGSGAYLINTQGVNILTNLFFGVVANAGRQVATQVDGIVKQFVNNVVIAINPQITKSYVAGDKEYSFDLVRKGSRYACLILLVFIVPMIFEADMVMHLWLGEKVPESAALFSQLTLLCLLLDLICTTFSTLILAHGRIKQFYIWTSAVTLLIFPLSWLAFSQGAGAHAAYIIFCCVYVVADVIKLIIVKRETGFPIKTFVTEVLLKSTAVAGIAIAITSVVRAIMPESALRLLAVAATSTVALALSTYFIALTPGEKAFVKSKLHIR